MEHDETREIPSVEQWVPDERLAPPMLNNIERRWEPPEDDRWSETERRAAAVGLVAFIASIGVAGIVALSLFPGGDSEETTAIEALAGSAEPSSVPTTPDNPATTALGALTTSEPPADSPTTAGPPTTTATTTAAPTTAPPTTAAPTTTPPTSATPTTAPTTTVPQTTAVPTTAAGECHPAYEGCLQNLPGDALNCGDIPASQKPVILRDVNVDPYGLDGNDRDGRGCEG